MGIPRDPILARKVRREGRIVVRGLALGAVLFFLVLPLIHALLS